jgi:hypothetical protein
MVYHKFDLDQQIKEDETNATCSMHERRKIVVRKFERRRHLERFSHTLEGNIKIDFIDSVVLM